MTAAFAPAPGLAAARAGRGRPGLPPEALTWCAFVVSVTAVLLGSAATTAAPAMAAFLAVWILLGLAYGRAAAGLLADAPATAWALPALALASVLWSQAPGDTLKFGLEYAGTVACAVLAASMMRPRALISALNVCLVATAVLSVLFGRTVVDPLTGSAAFVGVFGSKNQLAFFTSLMLLAGMALTLDSRQRLPHRALGLASIGLALPLLAATRSGTSVLTAGFAVAALLGNLVLSRMPASWRARVLCAGLIACLPVAALLLVSAGDLGAMLLGAMGKDATLTGRTVLWQRAAELIPRHPLLGHGYQAFWRQDTVEAESLWHEFHVDGRAGFHFHSTYVETAIELGYAGAAVLVATLLGTLRGLVRWSWRTGSVPASFFVALMACMLARSFVEVDVLFQFQIGTFVLFVAATYAARRPEDAA